MKTSHIPRLIKNCDNSFFDFLFPTIYADRPARKTKAGAQKWVIHLVKNNGIELCVGSEGSKNAQKYENSPLHGQEP
jgi:hypothetical protein